MHFTGRQKVRSLAWLLWRKVRVLARVISGLGVLLCHRDDFEHAFLGVERQLFSFDTRQNYATVGYRVELAIL